MSHPSAAPLAQLANVSARQSRVFGAEVWDLAFLAAHVPLAVLLMVVPGLSLLHSLAAVAVGLWWASAPATRHRTLLAAAYVAGGDVLWRMTGGAVFYEFGKYAVIVLLLAHLVSARLRPTPLGRVAVVSFLLLIPSIALTVAEVGAVAARGEVSFNLSGPLALAVAALALSATDPARVPLRRLLVYLLAPVVGIGAIAGRATLAADEIYFTEESNFVTSGGFGPNQVSALLGLGAVLAVLLALHTTTRVWRWCFLGLAMVLLTQAVLTFSRGGVLNALICLAILGLHTLPNRRLRIGFALGALATLAVASELVLPALDRFTGGALEARYSDVDPGLRQRLAEKELEIWRENPILGVGPGMAKYRRELAFGKRIAAHTEYTRLLSEHGILGAGALVILLALAVTAYLRAPTALARGWVAVFAGWPLLEMSHAAMRVSVISFAFGLALLPWARAAGGRQRRPGTR